MIVRSFLDACDLAGKKVMPFCTSGGSNISGAVDDLRDLYPDVGFADGLTVTTSHLGEGASMAADWIGA